MSEETVKNCENPSINQLLENISESAAPPRKNGELDFQEPWESRAFGMAIALYNEKRYTSWDDFRFRLMEQVGKWDNAVQREDWNYYEHWLAALERLVVETGALNKEELDSRTEEFLSGKREAF